MFLQRDLKFDLSNAVRLSLSSIYVLIDMAQGHSYCVTEVIQKKKTELAKLAVWVLDVDR